MVNFKIVIPKNCVLSTFSVCDHSLRVTCNLCWNIYMYGCSNPNYNFVSSKMKVFAKLIIHLLN